MDPTDETPTPRDRPPSRTKCPEIPCPPASSRPPSRLEASLPARATAARGASGPIDRSATKPIAAAAPLPVTVFVTSLLAACAGQAPIPSDAAVARLDLAPHGQTVAPAPHAGTVALTPDGTHAVVVHPDIDRVTLVDLSHRTVAAEIALGPVPTIAPDGRWLAPVFPCSVALAPQRNLALVAGRNSGELIAVDLTTRRVVARARVCTEPVAVLVAAAETRVLLACAPDRELLSLHMETLTVLQRTQLPDEPGALALTRDGGLVVTHPHTGGVTRLDAVTLSVTSRGTVPALPTAGHPLRANGVPRALHDAAERPTTGELWVVHALFSETTAQPTLNFETTVFPAIAVLDGTAPDRAPLRPTMTTDSRLAGEDGALLRVVSGLRAITFTPDGTYALVLARNSESLVVLDARHGTWRGIVEDLPGRLWDAVVMHPMGGRAWVHARGSGRLLALTVSPDGAVHPDGAPFPSRTDDPMPEILRTGQWMFSNANDRYQMFPITVNRWLSCENCHMDGGTAAVTQRFTVGPRDIPDLRQGLDGFLMRTATRHSLDDFWRTIAVEQGGQIRPDDDVFGPPFRALMAYVRNALPPVYGPRVDAVLAARGRVLFHRPDVGCARCHAGPRFTDSAEGNPTLDLSREVRLHDVGTCVRAGPHPDRPHEDITGRPRDACRFDTPTLRGTARSGPWLHDGSAATLRDVLTTRNPKDLHGATRALSASDIDALVEYLRSL